MIYSVLGRKVSGHTTELQRQTSICECGTCTPCMTCRHMGYSAGGVSTESFHAQYVSSSQVLMVGEGWQVFFV
jgi:hypothetical protein